jgi:hypothetical protein
MIAMLQRTADQEDQQSNTVVLSGSLVLMSNSYKAIAWSRDYTGIKQSAPATVRKGEIYLNIFF